MKKEILILSTVSLFATNGFAQQIFSNPSFVGTATPFSNTNVGIGTNNPLYGKLDVNGIIAAAPRTGAVTMDPIAGAYNAGTRFALNASTTNPYGIGIGAQEPSSGTYPMWFQTGGINGGGYKWYIGGTQKMSMDPIGNVRVGTNIGNPNAPAELFQVVGSGNGADPLVNRGNTIGIYDERAAAAGVGGQLIFGGTFLNGFRSTFAGIRGVKLNGTNGNYSGRLEFYTRNNGIDTWTGAQRMVIDNLGFVGIGTSTPSAQLHTTAGVRFQGLTPNAYSNVVVIDANGNLATQPFPGASAILNCSTTNFITKVTGANQMGCSQIFDNNINVGIGTTTPSIKLQVVGSGVGVEPLANSANTMGIYDSKVVAANVGGQLFFGGTFDNAANQTTFAGIRGIKLNATAGDYSGQLEFYTRNNGINSWAGTQRMVINNIGNVGIGTSTPSAQLHTTAGVRFQGLTPSAYNNVVVIDGSGNLATQPFPTAGATLNCSTTNFIPKVSGVNQMGCSQIIDDGANVGIGTTTPTYGKLDVNGIVAATPLGTAAATCLDPSGGAYNAGTRIAINASVANPYGIGIGAQDPSTGSYPMWFQTGGLNGGGYKWFIGGTQKMSMDPIGNVRVGTDIGNPDAPAELFQVVGSGNGGDPLVDRGNTIGIYDERSVAAGVGGQLIFGGTFTSANGGDRSTFAGIRGVKLNGTNGDYSGQLEFYTRNNTVDSWTGTQRMVINNIGNMGIGTSTPSTQLHTTGGVRFQGLTPNAYNDVVVIDANGNLATQPFSATGVTLNCNTTNFISKVTGTNQLDCSQIFDDGTSVGIGTSTGFTYTGGGSVLTSGGGGIPTGSTITLKVNGITQATSYIATSDERFKKDIKTIEKPLEKIAKLNGVGYNWKTNDFKSLGYKFDDTHQLGFIAQELQKVIPEAVIVDGNGYYGVNYNMLIPLLTEAIKEQQQMIESQNNKIDEMQAKMNSANLRAMAINSSSSDSISASIGKGAKLYQNVPNPFSQSTSITYFLPNTSESASIMIFDLSGKLLKTVPLNQKGSGSISINGNELNSGMYIYSLVIDGQEIESKRMILTE